MLPPSLQQWMTVLLHTNAATLSEVSIAIPLGITRDTPECNSTGLVCTGFHHPRLSVTGTKLLLGSFNVYRILEYRQYM
ncbi:hypothetical protein [Paenibacillus sp. GCM10012306]|uniref:hypothetical protein n=1 Tax=Paenibacillus sp. GCM10012306 TaxID=3317342 RepID=UPI00360CFF43